MRCLPCFEQLVHRLGAETYQETCNDRDTLLLLSLVSSTHASRQDKSRRGLMTTLSSSKFIDHGGAGYDQKQIAQFTVPS